MGIEEIGKPGFRYRTDFKRPVPHLIESYKGLMNQTGCLTGNVGDCLGRAAAMDSRVKGLSHGMKLVGPALTVKVPPIDKLERVGIQEAFKRYSSGKLSFERLSRYEMIELGFDPNNPEDVLKYDKFMNDLASNLDKMEEYLESFEEPTECDIEFEADFDLEEEDK